MGLFKAKKGAVPLQDENESSIPTHKKVKKFTFLKRNKLHHAQRHTDNDDDQVSVEATKKPSITPAAVVTPNSNIQPQEERDTPLVDVDAINDELNLGGIPRSISHASREENELLPPLPATPNDTGCCLGEGIYGGEEDSLGSPCESMRRHQQKLKLKTVPPTDEGRHDNLQVNIANQANIMKLQSIITPDATPTIGNLDYYIMALSPKVSPNPSGDLPARALRCLFTLSELSTQKQQRVKMVRGEVSTGDDINSSLIPALLSFLQRCPRDSSEQYLTLLVLNNLSIPTENKRVIGLQYNGVEILAKLLCQDPGCHLLVIIIVNLTFGDEALNSDLLTSVDKGESGVQLVDSLGYALLLASLTSDQLAILGPIPLTSPEGNGTPLPPRELLSNLFSLVESNFGVQYQGGTTLPPLLLDDDAYPFFETARWCLGALKNLTRPGKLSSSSIGIGNEEQQKDAVATRAILDAGILPLLLRILKSKGYDDTGTMHSWHPNSVQDAALYILLHMTSVPQVRKLLRVDYECVDVLRSVLQYGKVVIGEKSLVKDDDDESLRLLSLQCLKARLALSYLILEGDDNRSVISMYGSAAILAEFEAHSIIELLAHCLRARAKEGIGGYSAATFNLKGVLFAIKCILSDPMNRRLFAATGNASRLNALLIKAVSNYSQYDVSNILDAQAAEHAILSIYHMTLHGLDEKELGFSSSLANGVFLPSTYGDLEGKTMLIMILRSYLTNRDKATLKGIYATDQILYRLSYLRFEGCVEDLTYQGKQSPTKTDFDLDEKVLGDLKSIEDNMKMKGVKPEEHIFSRSITQYDGSDSKRYPSILAAAEDLALSITVSTTEQHPQEPLDVFSIANNIAYYAEGLDVYYGYTWKWSDGMGDLIERIYSAEQTIAQTIEHQDVEQTEPSPSSTGSPGKGRFGGWLNSGASQGNENDPITIFGLKCVSIPLCRRCDKGSVL